MKHRFLSWWVMLLVSVWLVSCGPLEVQIEPTSVATSTGISTLKPSPSETLAVTALGHGPTTPTAMPSMNVPSTALIPFETKPEQSLSDIAVIRADGTGYAQLTTYGYNSDPVLSPDGQFIAYRSVPGSITSLPDPGPRLYEGSYNIWVIAVDGSQAWKLTDSEAPRSVPAWSPNSLAVVFSEGVEGKVVEVDVATQTRREWLAQGGFSPRFKPDGNGLGYITTEGSLAWLQADGTPYVWVEAAALPPLTIVHDFNWMPKGDAVVYTLADERERIGESTLGIRYSLWTLTLGGSPLLLAEDAHAAQPSPNGQMLAVQVGSGYGDACGVDLYQAFLDATLTPPVPLLKVDGFTGRPAGNSFYPVSPITWLSERYAAAQFGVTCPPPETPAFGLYLIDVMGQQIQPILFQSVP